MSLERFLLACLVYICQNEALRKVMMMIIISIYQHTDLQDYGRMVMMHINYLAIYNEQHAYDNLFMRLERREEERRGEKRREEERRGEKRREEERRGEKRRGEKRRGEKRKCTVFHCQLFNTFCCVRPIAYLSYSLVLCSSICLFERYRDWFFLLVQSSGIFFTT